jgi:hypothetical protein
MTPEGMPRQSLQSNHGRPEGRIASPLGINYPYIST